MGFIKEFKEFAMRGNVIDLAIGVIIGAAFGKITTSLVSDIIMPPLGLIIGKVNFADLFINLSNKPYASLEEAKKAGAPTINYGLFINNILDFILVALAVFIIVRAINRLQRKGEAPPPPANTKDCSFCYSVIPIKATRCPNCTSQLAQPAV